MAIQFTTTRDASLNHGVKMLVYGKAGMGKTTLCSTLPRPCIISAEGGLLSLRGFDIPVIEIKTLNDLTEAYNWFANNPQAREHFDSVALDSISEIGEQVLANAKKSVKDPRQAYGELIEQMTKVIRLFRDLPGFNVLFTAKQEYQKDESTGRMMYVPSMPGSKLGQALPYFFDEVFHIGIGKNPDGTEYRRLLTQPDFQYDAKDRSGSLAAIEQPNRS
jgi:phage nucleotide-binding protein